MRKTDVKKENPPVRLLGTMFLLVLGLVVVYVVLALGIFALVQQLVHLDKTNYTLLWPILILTISAIWAFCWPSSSSAGIWRRFPG